jgi:SAM-dependent methyltransferase
MTSVSNDLAGELARRWPGLPAAEFERLFVSIVESAAPHRLDAWTAFYRNTLRELAEGGAPGGTNAEMAPVHARALSLARGCSVVEVGCCFGFLSLRLASAGLAVTAVDLVPGTVALLRAVAGRLRVPLNVVAGDARALPLASAGADTVYAVHLLEHLPPAPGLAAVRELLRVTRRRVVIAVPYEHEPNPTWGHVRTFDATTLAEVGAASGATSTVADAHGGWLILDK